VNDDHLQVLAVLYNVPEDRVRSIWHQTYDAVTDRLNARK